MQEVIVGISGGIDSAVSVYLLKEQGYKVKAVHLVLYDAQLESEPEIRKLGELLNVPVDLIDLREQFKHTIIDFYIGERMLGRTPSPCVQCNQNIKWDALLSYANSLGIEKVATGHYIRIKETDNQKRIYKALDSTKDQSYYLWGLRAEILNRAITPLGCYQKTEVREIATKINLAHLTQKKESAGLCFAQHVVNESYLKEILTKKGITPKEGKVYDTNNQIIGKHNGLAFYTVGQKKGLELDKPGKLCVKKISAEDNSIVADTWQNLYTTKFSATDINFFDTKELNNTTSISIKVRGFGLNPEGGLKDLQIENNKLHIELNQPAWAPAPGQPVVFYNRDLVIGGAIISEVF